MATLAIAPTEEPTFSVVEVREGAIVATLITGCTAREAGRIARDLGAGFASREERAGERAPRCTCRGRA